ncbi:MAG: hypothetical protein ACD_54C00371G0003 [uncultured bacterium]|nr:MAG: hypothetical protein ACD_54C00371G0003 [uncultured bacterium]
MSLPAPPARLFAAALPVSTLFKPLPVPLVAARPVSSRFSRFAPNTQLTEART